MHAKARSIRIKGKKSEITSYEKTILLKTVKQTLQIKKIKGKNKKMALYNPKKYKEKIKLFSPKTPLFRNVLCAFLIGGSICFLAQWLAFLYLKIWDEKDAYLMVTLTFILIGATLSAIGVYDRIAHMAGAGTLVPVTGFANAITSAALDTRSEGYVLGVGAKIFTVAGPVILYSTVLGMLYGWIYYIVTLLI